MISWCFKILAVLCVLGIENAMATVSSPSATSDAANLYYQFTYSGTPNFFQTFLDTDKNSATGYRSNNIGADYLLENSNLYRYSGSNGAWGWTRVKSVVMTNSSSTVRWSVAKSDVGSPAGLNLYFQTSNPSAASAVISQTVTVAASNSISLVVAGAPNLPYNGTSTLVTVKFSGVAPSSLSLSRDGFSAFASWPSGTFFTLSSDGKSISGNWCISASCWSNQTGAHVLNAVATYADGTTKSASVTVNAVDSTSSSTTTTMPPVTTTTLPPTTTTLPPPTTTTTTLPVATTGPTHYVSPSGNDLNAGTSSAPWRTIQKAANTVVAGDTVILMNGTYEEPSINMARGGTALAPVTFKAQNKWQAVISSYSGCNPGISVSASYITLQDFRMTTSPKNVTCGVYSSANIDIRAWEARTPTPSSPSTGRTGHISRGLKLDGLNRALAWKSNQDDTILENCVINSAVEAMLNSNNILRNNEITGQDQGGNSIISKGGARNTLIYNNLIHNKARNGSGIVLGGGSCDACHFDMSTNIEAYNNAAFNNIIINESGSYFNAIVFQGPKDSSFFNNVVIGGGISMYQGGRNTGPQAPAENPSIKNNIFVCNGSAAGYIAYVGSFNVDYNNFYNCTGVPSQAHAITGNPMFVNQASDWHLQPGSPAINSGAALTMPAYGGGTLNISFDKNGVVRSTPWDLGVYNVTP
jgi:hypothetical protein